MIKIENTKERKSFIRLCIWCVAVQGILYQGRNGNRRHISHDKQFQISRAPFVTIIRFITGGIRGREKEEGEKKKGIAGTTVSQDRFYTFPLRATGKYPNRKCAKRSSVKRWKTFSV